MSPSPSTSPKRPTRHGWMPEPSSARQSSQRDPGYDRFVTRADHCGAVGAEQSRRERVVPTHGYLDRGAVAVGAARPVGTGAGEPREVEVVRVRMFALGGRMSQLDRPPYRVLPLAMSSRVMFTRADQTENRIRTR
jgi:hypothetical protein